MPKADGRGQSEDINKDKKNNINLKSEYNGRDAGNTE
jgi:hypothetical protein